MVVLTLAVVMALQTFWLPWWYAVVGLTLWRLPEAFWIEADAVCMLGVVLGLLAKAQRDTMGVECAVSAHYTDVMARLLSGVVFGLEIVFCVCEKMPLPTSPWTRTERKIAERHVKPVMGGTRVMGVDRCSEWGKKRGKAAQGVKCMWFVVINDSKSGRRNVGPRQEAHKKQQQFSNAVSDLFERSPSHPTFKTRANNLALSVALRAANQCKAPMASCQTSSKRSKPSTKQLGNIIAALHE